MAKKILICFDEPGTGPAVLEAGRQLAKALKAEMVVLNVQPPTSGLTGYYERLFHEEMERIDSLFGGAGKEELLFVRRFFDGEGKLPNFKLVTGDPAEAILRELDGGGYRLAVIGIKRQRSPGEVAEEVIKKSPVDVLLAKV
jgi:nucleotide-binding universal stress UspA family protein